MPNNKLNYTWFILLALLWGGSYTAIKIMIIDVPPFFAAMLRVGLAWGVLWFIAWVTHKNERIAWSLRWKIWLIGLFPLGIPFALLFWGEQFVSPGLAGILCATMPLWAFILSLIFLWETTSISSQKILGLCLGLFGVIIIFWPMLHADNHQHQLMGSIILIFMAISYAIGALLNQQVLVGKKINFHANISNQMLSSFVFLLLLSAIFEKWQKVIPAFHLTSFWLALIYLSVLSTALAWIIYYHLISQWGAVRATSATYVAPIAAVFWDFLFFGTQPRWSEIIGVIIILTGVILIQITRTKNIVLMPE